MGVNASTEFLRLAKSFLRRSVGSILLTYLGLPFGINLREESTWEPLSKSLAIKLGVWQNKIISLGGGEVY
jgi:hypothetical protein